MDLTSQRRMAAAVLKCGKGRVWIDPTRLEDVADAITRGDIRMAIRSGAIKKKQKVGISSARTNKIRLQKLKGRRKGHGRRKGRKYARKPKKERWIQTIRPIRRTLRELRESESIDRSTYRIYYRQAKGGMFKNQAHLKSQMIARGNLEEGKL